MPAAMVPSFLPAACRALTCAHRTECRIHFDVLHTLPPQWEQALVEWARLRKPSPDLKGGFSGGRELSQPVKQRVDALTVNIGKGDAELAFSPVVAFWGEHGAGQHKNMSVLNQLSGNFV